jgi:hypothetical protein
VIQRCVVYRQDISSVFDLRSFRNTAKVPVVLLQYAFNKRHQQPSSFTHGGLRIAFVVSATKRDAESVPRLAEGSPRNEMQCVRSAGSASQAFSVRAHEVGERQSICDRLPGSCRACLF